MNTCRHCGGRIYQVNWYNGPGWKHDRGDWACPPITYAEPVSEQPTRTGA